MTALVTPRPAARTDAGDPDRPDHRSAARLGQLLDRWVPGRSLPGPCYTDPEVYRLELELLWARQWVFVGSTAEVPEPGDYLTVDLGASSVLVLRDDDEQVRALHNVCRHRGSRLVGGPRGSVGNLVCGYHHWTYATDGRLLHAPQLTAGTDTSCLGLRPVHLREVAGLLFVCLGAEPPADIDDLAATVTPYLAPHRLDRAKVAAQVDLVEHGNWKLVMENNRECYHCDGHPELLRTFFPTWGLADSQVPPRLRPAHERYRAAEAELHRACDERGLPHTLVEDLVDRSTGFRIQREALDGVGESFSRDGSRLVARLLGDLDEPRLGRVTFHLQPNLWTHVLADHAVTFSVLPLAPGRTLLRTTWLVHEDAVAGVDYDAALLTEVWQRTNEQDAAFVASTQAGVADPAYEPGPHTEGEAQVGAFLAWYAARVREEADR